MKYTRTMFNILLFALMLNTACTEEFEYVIPPKYPNGTGSTPIEYDITFADLLEEMQDAEEVAKYPAWNYTTHQASSYDRVSVTPGVPEWYANVDGRGYIRTEKNEGRTEYVMMEHYGPGVITRIWLTSLTDKNAVVRFYFDGSEKPNWTVDCYNMREFDKVLRDGDAPILNISMSQPISWTRGSNLWLPIPYGKSCKITYQEQSQAGEPTRYFHINYRKYDSDVAIQTFSEKVFNANRALVQELGKLLSSPKGKVSGRQLTASGTIAQNERLDLELTAGSNAVTNLRIKVNTPKASYEEVMDGLIFVSEFDGKVTAALPLADLVLAGPGAPKVASFYVDNSGDGDMTLRYIMPYEATGKLSIVNTSSKSAEVMVVARVGAFSRDERTLYFHAAAKKSPNMRMPLFWEPANCYEWNFVTIEGGRGVYRGDMYSVNNYTHNWPGEGDEKIWVDDDTFPSHFGTGVEDYYCFCHELHYQYPFAGQPRVDTEWQDYYGFTNYMRVRNMDAIPFNKSLKFDLEVQGHDAGTVDLRNAVIWYGDLNTKAVGMQEYNFE